MPREEARAHWTNVHGPLGLKAGLKGYVQNHVIGALSGPDVTDDEVFIDGYSLESWDDQAAFEQTLASPAWEEVVADGHNVFDRASLVRRSAYLAPRVLRDGPRLPFKVVWFARFRPGLDREEAGDHWLKIHGAIALERPEVGRYVQNLVLGAIEDGQVVPGGDVDFDGFSECWFKSREAYDRALASEAWGRLEADGEKIFDMTAMMGGMSALLEERILREPPAL